jgi:hypothetical protein
LLFWKKEITKLLDQLTLAFEFSWGQAPKPPWFRFAEGWGSNLFCEAEQRFLLLFLEKE